MATDHRNLKHILFDLDGTLTDSGPGIVHCIQRALEELGQPHQDLTILGNFIGTPMRDVFAKILGSANEQLVSRAISAYRKIYGRSGIIENKRYNGIREMLIRLQAKGYKLFVVTSKPTVVAKQVVAHLDLDDYFHAIHGSNLDGSNANKTELIRRVLIIENIFASQSAMVGDRAYDIVGAKKSGLTSIAALWGYGSRDELIQCEPDLLVGNPHDLVATILQLP